MEDSPPILPLAFGQWGYTPSIGSQVHNGVKQLNIIVMKTTFTDQCTGQEFINRNASLEIKQTKSGKMFFTGSTDERGYISDEAADILQEEMAKPGASLKSAICMLSFSVIHTVNDEGDEVAIPTLHKTATPAPTLWSY